MRQADFADYITNSSCNIALHDMGSILGNPDKVVPYIMHSGVAGRDREVPSYAEF
jgi:hypothetical protein